MGFNTKLPPCFRFDPTDRELFSLLELKNKDENDVNVAFIPLIKMQHHDPSEFPGLGAVMGKDGIMYIFADWDKKYATGNRRARQVKMGSITGYWKLSASEPIRSSNGDEQIGEKKKYDFKVGGSLVEWHMEEYRPCKEECKEERKQFSICRVSKKCSQGRGTTKIDAKVDIRFGEQCHFDHVTEVTNCPKSLRETHSHDHHISHSATETYNCSGQEEGQFCWCNFCSQWCRHDEPFHHSLRNYCNRLHDLHLDLFWLNSFLGSDDKTYNSNEQEESQPYWCYFCYKCHPHDEPFHRSLRKFCNRVHDKDLLFLLLPNVGHLGPQANNSKGEKEAAQSCISGTGNGPERETLDMDYGREINKGQKDGGPPCRFNLCSGLYAPKETGYSCRDNVDNPDTGNCQSANDTVLDMNDMTEMVGNLNTGNWQSANDIVLLDTPNHFLSPDTGLWDMPISSNAVEEEIRSIENFLLSPDTGLGDMPTCTNAADTVPMDMDDVTKTGNCVSSPGQTIFYKDLEDTCQLLG